MKQMISDERLDVIIFKKFIVQLIRNYLFGGAVAVLGVGSILIFSTLQLSSIEIIRLALLLVVSLIIMFSCEWLAFKRHIRPIRNIFYIEATSAQLREAYLQVHNFPLLSVKRIAGPHFLGLAIPVGSLTYISIKLQWIVFPYYYIAIGAACAVLIAAMHAMLEFFLTTRAIPPLITHIRAMHIKRFNADLTLEGQVLVTIRRKFLLSAFIIGTLPMLMFSLATQIRIEGYASTSSASAAYWQWAVLILIIGILFSWLSASLLSKDIQSPIETLQQALVSVQEGKLDHKAEDIYSDEFSKLVAGFNHMVDGLKEREKRNAQLLQSYFITLAAALEARDLYTAGHSERVAEYAVLIGQLAGWDDSVLDTIRKSALLHDIGKIGVRDAVLLKDGKLTDEEFDQIKQHPILGENILRRIEPADAMEHLLPGVRSHHERFDGKGYPDGLAGENIPLLGKVIAIADAFDAMTSDRPYRKGMTVCKALTILEEGKGTQWDPGLAELFIRWHREQQASEDTRAEA
ncbi:HD domain-containing phosphohydrolase [Paenibacillus sp. BIHB 4019]|uniref:HD-GYP domain-containing protein n=1 Tax=Paenibacillus sp. BIHB 4019 TaxID=1870819 RepID=UPI001F3D2611|nr:HD domain-containing phosphohydrolase [Paenibacillus sp. BIHB 4019]